MVNIETGAAIIGTMNVSQTIYFGCIFT